MNITTYFGGGIRKIFSSPESTGKAKCIAVSLALTVVLALALVIVFKRLYLLNLWMEVIHTCPDVRYWSEVLCCTISTHISDLEVTEKKLC